MSTPDENVALVSEWMKRSVNGRDLEFIDEVIHPEYMSHGHTGFPDGPDGERETLKAFWTAFPDFVYTPHAIIANDEGQVGMFATFTGTHGGDYEGIPATGKPVEIQSMELLQFKDGKVIEHWGVFEIPKLYQQMGVEPPAGSPLHAEQGQ